MVPVRVYVTQEDIDKGKPKDMYQCPIALAVRRLVPDRASSVTDELCIPRRNLPPRYVEPYCEDLPSEASEFISHQTCLLYTSPSPRDRTRSRMPSSA